VVPRHGDAAKSQGLARLRSIGRLWSKGGLQVGASSSSSSCHRATAGGAQNECSASVAAGNSNRRDGICVAPS
jgi:E3 ubiquitin-protein ligase EL5